VEQEEPRPCAGPVFAPFRFLFRCVPGGTAASPTHPAALHTLPTAALLGMKRAATPSSLLDRSTPWLAWWQELILNWVASWHSIGILHVTSSATDEDLTWDVPSDLDLARLELEELLDVPGSRGEG
jgi:hypothetical protein